MISRQAALLHDLPGEDQADGRAAGQGGCQEAERRHFGHRRIARDDHAVTVVDQVASGTLPLL